MSPSHAGWKTVSQSKGVECDRRAAKQASLSCHRHTQKEAAATQTSRDSTGMGFEVLCSCLLAPIPCASPDSLKQVPSQALSHRLMTEGKVLRVRGGGCSITAIVLGPLRESRCREQTAIHWGEGKMEIVGHDSSVH